MFVDMFSSEYDENRKLGKDFHARSGLSGPINVLFNGELLPANEITLDDIEQVGSSSFGPIVSSDTECSCLKPVHSVIIESRQTKCPFGGWYRWQEASMWSVDSSSDPHLQFAEGTKPHLCIVERRSGLVWPRKI